MAAPLDQQRYVPLFAASHVSMLRTTVIVIGEDRFSAHNAPSQEGIQSLISFSVAWHCSKNSYKYTYIYMCARLFRLLALACRIDIKVFEIFKFFAIDAFKWNCQRFTQYRHRCSSTNAITTCEYTCSRKHNSSSVYIYTHICI